MCEFREITNKFGFIDYVDHDDYVVCCQCHAMKMPNRGAGTLCDSCQYQDEMESAHDYYNGDMS